VRPQDAGRCFGRGAAVSLTPSPSRAFATGHLDMHTLPLVCLLAMPAAAPDA
jgi:hypothetical protein